MKTRPKIGIAFSDLGSSQSIFYLIMEAAKRHEEMDFILFFENQNKPPLRLPCASMPIYEMWSFKGPVIATNLSTAYKLIQAASPTQKFLYCWDLEWMRLAQKNYNELSAIYRNPDIELISRTNDHKIIIENAWNKPVNFVHENWKGVFENEQISNFSTQTRNKEIPFLVYGAGKRVPRTKILN